MRVLITGSQGYVAPEVIRGFKSVDPHGLLIGVDLGWYATEITANRKLADLDLDVQKYQDVRNLTVSDLKDVDVVVHLAALSNDPLGSEFEQLTRSINEDATIHIAQQARAAGIRKFIFASSASVYGIATGSCNESALVNPQTAYAKSKYNSETRLREIATEGFQVVCLRFSTACGWSDRVRTDLVLNDFVYSALTSRCIELISDGTPERPLITTEDMARAILGATFDLPSETGNFVVMNIGSSTWNYQILELANATASIIGGVDVQVGKKPSADTRSYRLSFELFEKALPGWQPKSDINSVVESLARNMKPYIEQDHEFFRRNTIRLMKLRQLRNSGLLDEALVWT